MVIEINPFGHNFRLSSEQLCTILEALEALAVKSKNIKTVLACSALRDVIMTQVRSTRALVKDSAVKVDSSIGH